MRAKGETMTIRELRERVVRRAADDGEFRSRLLADPHGALQGALGMAIPRELGIEVHEETADTAHLVLPPSSVLDEQTLAQAQGADIWDGVRYSLGIKSVGSS